MGLSCGPRDNRTAQAGRESRRRAHGGRQQSWRVTTRRNIRRLSFTTPPGSESRACVQRGNSETWEGRLSPSTASYEDGSMEGVLAPAERFRRRANEAEAKVPGSDS